MAYNERKNLCFVLFLNVIYFLSFSADFSDSEDAVYLTTMDTPLVGIGSACFKQHVATLVCLWHFLNTLSPRDVASR